MPSFQHLSVKSPTPENRFFLLPSRFSFPFLPYTPDKHSGPNVKRARRGVDDPALEVLSHLFTQLGHEYVDALQLLREDIQIMSHFLQLALKHAHVVSGLL